MKTTTTPGGWLSLPPGFISPPRDRDLPARQLRRFRLNSLRRLERIRQRGPDVPAVFGIERVFPNLRADFAVQLQVQIVPSIGAAFERLHLSENFKRARGDLDLPLLRLAALEHGESPGAVGA